MNQSNLKKDPLETTGGTIWYWIAALGCIIWILPFIAVFLILIFGTLFGESGFYIGGLLSIVICIGIFHNAKENHIKKVKEKAKREEEEEEIRLLTLEKLRREKEMD